MVRVAPFSTTATTVVWSGLEAFNNEGLVDLRNGHTGDIFQLTGFAFTGSVNSALGVDVAFGPTLTSDKLVIGAAGGQTTVLPTDVTPGAAPTLDLTGTTVVQGTSGTASQLRHAHHFHKRASSTTNSGSMRRTRHVEHIVGVPR